MSRPFVGIYVVIGEFFLRFVLNRAAFLGKQGREDVSAIRGVMLAEADWRWEKVWRGDAG